MSNQVAKSSNPKRECRAFFSQERSCKRGSKCPYHHDLARYMSERGIKECPNSCGRFCLPASKQCSGCVQELREQRQAERAAQQKEYEEWVEEYPLQQCKSKGKRNPDGTYEWECKNQTRYSLCKECYNTEKLYVIRR